MNQVPAPPPNHSFPQTFPSPPTVDPATELNQLQKRIDTVKTEVTRRETELKSIDQQLTDLRAEVKTLGVNDFDELDASIIRLESEIATEKISIESSLVAAERALGLAQ